MKKVDLILKKAELFERLSVYGDRKSFLAALAQDQSVLEPNLSLESGKQEYVRPPSTVINLPEVKINQGDPKVAKYYTLAQNAKNLVDRIAIMHEVSDKQNLARFHGPFIDIMHKVDNAINDLNTMNSSEAKSLLNKLQAIKSKANLPGIKNKTEKANLEVSQKGNIKTNPDL